MLCQIALQALAHVLNPAVSHLHRACAAAGDPLHVCLGKPIRFPHATLIQLMSETTPASTFWYFCNLLPLCFLHVDPVAPCSMFWGSWGFCPRTLPVKTQFWQCLPRHSWPPIATEEATFVIKTIASGGSARRWPQTIANDIDWNCHWIYWI